MKLLQFSLNVLWHGRGLPNDFLPAYREMCLIASEKHFGIRPIETVGEWIERTNYQGKEQLEASAKAYEETRIQKFKEEIARTEQYLSQLKRGVETQHDWDSLTRPLEARWFNNEEGEDE